MVSVRQEKGKLSTDDAFLFIFPFFSAPSFSAHKKEKKYFFPANQLLASTENLFIKLDCN